MNHLKNFLSPTLIILLVIPIYTNIINSADPKADLLIGIIGDQTGAAELDTAYQILEKAVEKLKKHQPELVLHVGDIIESVRGVNSFDDYKKNFDRAVKIMDRLEAPWFLTAGDHDVVPPKFKPLSLDRSREAWFLKLCQNSELPVKENLYYSFNFKGYHFISLYSLENLHTDPRWGPIFCNKLSSTQIEWLKNDLEIHKNAPGILIFTHQPHWYVWSNWFEIHQILRKYPVAGVIAGHYHYDQDDGIIDGIHYLVVGSSGGIVKNTDPHSGGAHQYATIKLSQHQISETILYEVDTDSVLEFTPRVTMDRIQAIGCMLDNLYMDEIIYREDGLLYKPNELKGSDKLNRIGLESMANPIDLPINIEVLSFSDGLYNPQWICNSDTSEADEAYELLPGQRIGWSNYTNVGQWGKPLALWQCDVREDSAYWAASPGISLELKVTFRDDRERWIRSSTFFPINQKH